MNNDKHCCATCRFWGPIDFESTYQSGACECPDFDLDKLPDEKRGQVFQLPESSGDDWHHTPYTDKHFYCGLWWQPEFDGDSQ